MVLTTFWASCLCIFLLSGAVAFAQTGHSPTTQPMLNTMSNLHAGRSQTVVVYGTSLSINGEWAKALSAYFKQKFPKRVDFINAAQSGQHSKWGLENLSDRVLSKHPDLVFIEFSVNDSATKHHISIEQSIANLDAMISALRQQNPRVDIILQTMNNAWDSPDEPSKKKYASDRPQLEKYYDAYRTYAQAHHLPLIDHYPNWVKLQQDDPEQFRKWLPEGLHPIPQASLAITWPAIRAFLDAASGAAPTTIPAH